MCTTLDATVVQSDDMWKSLHCDVIRSFTSIKFWWEISLGKSAAPPLNHHGIPHLLSPSAVVWNRSQYLGLI